MLILILIQIPILIQILILILNQSCKWRSYFCIYSVGLYIIHCISSKEHCEFNNVIICIIKIYIYIAYSLV